MISLGLDIGTTTLRATAIDVTTSPLGDRRTRNVGSALCTFTPFRKDGTLDEDVIIAAVSAWLPAKAEVGTALFTGEAQRARNCREVGEKLLVRFPGLLCAQLDPHLESLVAAHGAGAVELSSRRLGRTVIHIDIGGGTANYARIENGRIVDTACLDAGGRKWVLDTASGAILRRTRIGAWLETKLPQGFSASKAATLIADVIATFAAGEPVEDAWVVAPWKMPPAALPLVSLSGGVVECWETPEPPFRYGDLGPSLASALRAALEARGLETHLSLLEGRATALGISAFGFQVSGNSLHGERFRPLRNVPLRNAGDAIPEGAECAFDVPISDVSAAALEREAARWAERLRGTSPSLVVFVLQPNVAKAFGWFFRRHAGELPAAWALDGIDTSQVPMGPVRTLDVGSEGPDGRLPVVVKTLRPF